MNGELAAQPKWAHPRLLKVQGHAQLVIKEAVLWRAAHHHRHVCSNHAFDEIGRLTTYETTIYVTTAHEIRRLTVSDELRSCMHSNRNPPLVGAGVKACVKEDKRWQEHVAQA